MQSFNLCHEKWIPTSQGDFSLIDLIEKDQMFSGSAIEKLSIFNLLKAIAQSAITPKTERDWASITEIQFKEKLVEYLKENENLFGLYDKAKPFLQFPVFKGKIAKVSVNAISVTDLSSNATVLFDSQRRKNLTDAEKARVILSQMGFAKSGKVTDNSVSLTQGHKKEKSSCIGSSLGFMGFLHNHVMVSGSLLKSLMLNLYSVESARSYVGDLDEANPIGVAPWERMPTGEDCSTARLIQRSIIGRLVPMGRFLLLEGNEVYITEGIRHEMQTAGKVDPTVAINLSEKKPKVIWALSDKKPWRELPALLGFLAAEKKGFNCPQIRMAVNRLQHISSDEIEIWSAGTNVSSNAGEQYLSGKNDHLDSIVQIERDALGETSYLRLKSFFALMDDIRNKLYGSVTGFYKELGEGDKGGKKASNACEFYWIECEKKLPLIFFVIQDSDFDSEESMKVKREILSVASQTFDRFCQKKTARQIAAWAKKAPSNLWITPKKGK